MLRLLLFAALVAFVDQQRDWRAEATQLDDATSQPINLNLQNAMKTLHRMKRATKRRFKRQFPTNQILRPMFKNPLIAFGFHSGPLFPSFEHFSTLYLVQSVFYSIFCPLA
jgi:hypothetical protein